MQRRELGWNKWLDFKAGIIIRGEKLNEFLKEGNKLIPTQWIEVDKNAHLIQSGNYPGPEFKSRLVACGQFEDAVGLR